MRTKPTTSKTKMADGGKRSSRTEGFHRFRVWDPKTWLGNTKITEAFVYQLCRGYRTVKSRRQPVKISTNFVFLPGYSSSALRYSSDYSAWLRIATYFREWRINLAGDEWLRLQLSWTAVGTFLENQGTWMDCQLIMVVTVVYPTTFPL